MSDVHVTDEGSRAISQKDLRFPVGITMDPAGIDLFAMILHILYAHQANPERPQPHGSKHTFKKHFDNAYNYLRESNIVTRVRWAVNPHLGADRETYVYELMHPLRGQDTITIAIDPCQPDEYCLFVLQNDKFLQMDLDKINLLDPA
jgi:hypothetical protein